MHVLVTGGAGFIGSHLVDALIARGDRVTVLDDFSTGSKSNLPISDRLTVLEFRLGRTLPPELEGNGFDAVVHLAGLPSVSASWEKPMEAHDRNLSATLALLDALPRLGNPRFVFASSAAVYGLPVTLPIPESAPCAPLSPYGMQKRASEQYMELFARQLGFCGVALRFFNVYGPRQRPDSAYSGVISIFADAIKRGEPLTIYGDGSQTRDFVFVADVVRRDLRCSGSADATWRDLDLQCGQRHAQFASGFDRSAAFDRRRKSAGDSLRAERGRATFLTRNLTSRSPVRLWDWLSAVR